MVIPVVAIARSVVGVMSLVVAVVKLIVAVVSSMVHSDHMELSRPVMSPVVVEPSGGHGKPSGGH